MFILVCFGPIGLGWPEEMFCGLACSSRPVYEMQEKVVWTDKDMLWRFESIVKQICLALGLRGLTDATSISFSLPVVLIIAHKEKFE